MTIVFPLFGSRVSPRFDCAPAMLLVTAAGGEVTGREIVSMEGRNSLDRVNWLCQQSVDVIICGGISCFTMRMLTDRGLRVYPWVTGDIDDALRLFLRGQLQSGLVIGPGGSRRRWRCRGRGRGFSGRTGRFSE